MTVGRWLLVSGILVLTTFGVLAFGNSQWKYCYMFQAYVLNNEEPISQLHDGFISWRPIPSPKIMPKKHYVGFWKRWNKEGVLCFIESISAVGKSQIVYFPTGGIDRRKELGIEVE